MRHMSEPAMQPSAPRSMRAENGWERDMAKALMEWAREWSVNEEGNTGEGGPFTPQACLRVEGGGLDWSETRSDRPSKNPKEDRDLEHPSRIARRSQI